LSKAALLGADLVRGAVAVPGDEPGGVVMGDEVPERVNDFDTSGVGI
jgi:hypothetical protein